MGIPENYKSLPGYKTTYTEDDLRRAIAICEAFILNNLGGGGGGGGGGGDATSANQLLEITALNSILGLVTPINSKIPSNLNVVSNRLLVDGNINVTLIPLIQTLVLVNPAIQYILNLDKCNKYTFKVRNSAGSPSGTIRYSFVNNGVFDDNLSYRVDANYEESENLGNNQFTGIIYFKSETVANIVLEIKTWSLP